MWEDMSCSKGADEGGGVSGQTGKEGARSHEMAVKGGGGEAEVEEVFRSS